MIENELEADFYEGVEDFTFFLPSERFRPFGGQEFQKKQWDETVRLKSRSVAGSVLGRLNASRCFGGQFMSCSFRATGEIPPTSQPYHKKYDPASSSFNPKRPKHRNPSDNRDGIYVSEQPSERHLSSMEQLCDVIFKRIFSPAQSPHGLIIISGATATGKSQIARGLIYKYLVPLVPHDNSSRRPHLVTYEDPIDKLWANDPDAAKDTGVDYTPRELGKDVDSLADSITAVLRQTPKVFFIGETRDSEDWTSLLRFASTGHVAITTSHAGSLTEAMGEILRAAKADSPALRSEIANRIMAVVHLRNKKVYLPSNESSAYLNITIPAIWVRSPVSMKTLMADGLTALLPYRDGRGWDEEPGQAGQLGCLGRSWFAERLLERSEPPITPAVEDEVRRVGLMWDLEGI